MLFQSSLRWLLMAAAATATPFLEPRGVSEGFTREVELFKRGANLEARDLQLAEAHGVNLTEMHKHSVLKRHDGDHVTIWVHSGIEDIEGSKNDRELGMTQEGDSKLGVAIVTSVILTIGRSQSSTRTPQLREVWKP
ncbi:hypothetical protein FVER14953_10761 [Fusarium verticillioides]|nr:hypothetical protein FVER14953_10761 [Fusarium verticillioides]